MCLENALMIFIEQLLAGRALGGEDALIAIENWNINRNGETGSVDISRVARLREAE